MLREAQDVANILYAKLAIETCEYVLAEWVKEISQNNHNNQNNQNNQHNQNQFAAQVKA